MHYQMIYTNEGKDVNVTNAIGAVLFVGKWLLPTWKHLFVCDPFPKVIFLYIKQHFISYLHTKEKLQKL